MKENWVYRRGDLYLANLGVLVGSKQGGVRPVVVLQNDVGNYYAPTITIAPLTSKIEKKRKQPTHFFLKGTGKTVYGIGRTARHLRQDMRDSLSWAGK